VCTRVYARELFKGRIIAPNQNEEQEHCLHVFSLFFSFLFTVYCYSSDFIVICSKSFVISNCDCIDSSVEKRYGEYEWNRSQFDIRST